MHDLAYVAAWRFHKQMIMIGHENITVKPVAIFILTIFQVILELLIIRVFVIW